MAQAGSYRWRKCTDVNRTHALFELLADDTETPILDIGFADDGSLEVAFNTGVIIEWERLLRLLQEGKALAEHDRCA